MRATQELQDVLYVVCNSLGKVEPAQKEQLDAELKSLLEHVLKVQELIDKVNEIDKLALIERIAKSIETATQSAYRKMARSEAARGRIIRFIKGLEFKELSRADRMSEACEQMSTALADISDLKDELESWKENLPESLQNSQIAETLDASVSTLEDQYSQIESAIQELEGVEFPSMYGD